MSILISGANGFLGSSLANYLFTKNKQIILVVRANSNIDRIRGISESVEIVRYHDVSQLHELLKIYSPEIIIHTACSYGRNGESLMDIFDANIRLGVALLQYANKLNKDGVTFINAGTALPENVNLYSFTKNQFSQFCVGFVKQTSCNIKFIETRLHNFYGPGESISKFISKLFNDCIQNKKVIALTSGEQIRDFIYITDVLRAFEKIIDKNKYIDSFMEFEIGSGIPVSVREFAQKVKAITEADTFLDFGSLPYVKNECMYLVANLRNIRQLGWSPLFNIESGIKEMFNSIKNL